MSQAGRGSPKSRQVATKSAIILFADGDVDFAVNHLRNAPKSQHPIRSFVEQVIYDDFVAQMKRLAAESTVHANKKRALLESLAAAVKFDAVEDLFDQMQSGLPEGISVGVLTKDISTALNVTRNITAGNVWMNCFLGSDDPGAPLRDVWQWY